MKTPFTQSLVATLTLILSATVESQQVQVATIPAGAAVLDNGSTVVVGQPFAGLTTAPDNSALLNAGILPVLSMLASSSGGTQIYPSLQPANGQFAVSFTATPGTTYVVQMSTNLVDWADVWTNLAASSVLLFQDAWSTSVPQRFYRVGNR